MNRERTARIFSALGSDVRLEVVEHVSHLGEMCICELIDALGMSQANVSRHVGILRDAGVLRSRKVRALVLLRVDLEALRAASIGLADELERNMASAPAEDAEARLARRCALEE